MAENEQIGVPCAVDGCDERIVGLDDGWDLGRGTTCQDCIDYHDRHCHWPDESVEICAECRIDDGMTPHDCEESFADRVLVEPGTKCGNCDFEAPVSDGGIITDVAERAARATGERLETELLGAWRAGLDWLHLYRERPGSFAHKPLSESLTLTYRVLPTDSPRPPRPDELEYIRSYDLRHIERPMIELARQERTVGDSDD